MNGALIILDTNGIIPTKRLCPKAENTNYRIILASNYE
jgi:hypothetical protein